MRGAADDFPEEPDPSRPGRVRRRLLAVAAGVLAALAAGEAGIRIKDARAGYPGRLRATGGMQGASIPDGHLRIRWRPGYRVAPHAHFPKEWNTNSRGYRGTREVAVPKPEGVFRVLCLGGSTTACTDVTQDEAAWPARLEALWNDAGGPDGARVEVVNAAVAGWTSLESLVFLATEGVELDPDMVVVMHVVNDVKAGWVEGLRPDYRPWSGVLVRPCDTRTRLDGWLGWSRLYLAARDAFWRANTPPDAMPLFWTDPARVPGAWRAEGIDPAAAGYFRANLEHLCWIARGRGVRPVLLTMPCTLLSEEPAVRMTYESPCPGASAEAYAVEHARYNGIVREVAVAQEAGLADMAAAMPLAAFSFDDSVHVNDAGAREFAAALLPLLRR